MDPGEGGRLWAGMGPGAGWRDGKAGSGVVSRLAVT